MGKKKKVGKAARNARATQNVSVREQDYTKAPHSFVFHRGHVGKTVKELVYDIRKMMEPYTASQLKVRKKNVMKDFLTIAGALHVSHFIVFTKTETATYLRLICVPKGPTLTFKVNEFCLTRDVLSAQRHPDVDASLFSNYAVMVTNIPADEMENKLMNITFKNMFPSINPNTVKLNKMRRTVLINYNQGDKSIDLRHYTMRVVPTGLSRGMKKLMKSKLPNLSSRSDISEIFLDKGLSDSEGEQDGPHNQVKLSQRVKDRGVSANSTNAIRLKEIGPRINLQLVKIEEGFDGGNVLYHALIKKTPEEMAVIHAMREKKKKEKLARRQRQEANVLRKKEAKDNQVKKTIEGMKRKAENNEIANSSDAKKSREDSGESETDSNESQRDDDDDDDVEFFRQEVGEEPQPEMFTQVSRKRKATLKKTEGLRVKRSKTSCNNSNIESGTKVKKGKSGSKFRSKTERDSMSGSNKSKAQPKSGSKPGSKFSIKFSKPSPTKRSKKGPKPGQAKVLRKKGQKAKVRVKR